MVLIRWDKRKTAYEMFRLADVKPALASTIAKNVVNPMIVFL